MSGRVRLALVLHNHQPIGNFEGVFEDAYRDSYMPFLDVLSEFPELPISLHNSGSLLEWLVEAHPEYIDRVRLLVERGQVEILGGPFYEPILACIPRRDRVGQMTAYKRYLEKLFGTQVRGMWVPERVWEQSFAGDIADAGIEYTVLDDYHFRNAGLQDDQLHGYYLTEEDGRLLKIFPVAERLRYTIPFAEPQESIDYLRSIAGRFPNAIVTFGDDGEKFGTWPFTKETVYEKGWLRQFFELLRANADWIKVTTLSEAVDQVSPTGKVYLPDASYREMTEWVLPTERQMQLLQIVRNRSEQADWPAVRQFMRGGFWRNFLVKYPEANEMYTRMLQISQRLDELQRSGANGHTDLLTQARVELYRGQCNCPYWHGAFGGLYLPHLRNAIYHRLIGADNLLTAASGYSGRWVQIDTNDYNLDARREVRLSGDRLVAYLAPARGGHLYELDIRSIRHNLLATLNRREEAYHDQIRRAARNDLGEGGLKVAAVSENIVFKHPDLDKRLTYDTWARKSLVDHFLQPGLTYEKFEQGQGEMADFHTGVYQTILRRSEERVEACLSREGQLGPYRIKLTKTISLDRNCGGNLSIHYQLENLPADVPIHFGVEFNFAGMAAGAFDRYYYDQRGRQLGQLESRLELPEVERIGLVDEWLGLDVSLEMSQPADLWTLPIQTVSQSEGGYELVHQSCCVLPRWEFVADGDGRWNVDLTLSIDTSAAQARQLAESANAPTELTATH